MRDWISTSDHCIREDRRVQGQLKVDEPETFGLQKILKIVNMLSV